VNETMHTHATGWPWLHDLDQLLILILVLAGAHGVVMGAVALVTGWRLFSDSKPPRYRRGVVVPPADVTGRDGGDVQ
jgi:hypothetical protein